MRKTERQREKVRQTDRQGQHRKVGKEGVDLRKVKGNDEVNMIPIYYMRI